MTAPPAGGLAVDLPGAAVRLRATRWPGVGPPVLLLHGLASTRRIWDRVVPGLAGLPVIALDQRGHGESERPAGPYDGDTLVRDALTALDAVGLSRVVLVGHSWGATTALRVAAQAPDRVLACVAIDGGTDAFTSLRPTRAGTLELLTPPRLAEPADRLRAAVAAGPLAPWWSPEVEAAVMSVYEQGPDGLMHNRLPFEAHMQVLDDLLDTDHDALWARVRCPAWLVACLSLAGEETLNAAKDDALQRAARVLARPRLLRWTGAVHDVPLQWPALVAGLVRAAVDDTAVHDTAVHDTVALARAGEGDRA